MTHSQSKQLQVAVIGGGIGGLSAALALRRAGHLVKVYERRSFEVEVGASISVAANGGYYLQHWKVDIPGGKPVNLKQLVMRDWETGDILNQYDLSDYENNWGRPYFMFHRQDLHSSLLEKCLKEKDDQDNIGEKVEVIIDHVAKNIDCEKGEVEFENGNVVSADLIVGADGIRSKTRSSLGVTPVVTSAPQSCYRCNVLTSTIKELGLVDHAASPAIQFWGGIPDLKGERSQYYKIVMSPCRDSEIVSFYCFLPTDMTNHTQEGFNFAEVPVSELLVGEYANLDPACVDLLKNSVDRMPWRLYFHEVYSHWYKGNTCILGDAAHPMMPHQSQGACQAIEDAGALGNIFSKPQFTQSSEAINKGLELYQTLRKERATRVQSASRKALENLNERIGFSSLNAHEQKLAAGEGKLTVNEMNEYDPHAHLEAELIKMEQSSASKVLSPLDSAVPTVQPSPIKV